jgi:hypothetical protein
MALGLRFSPCVAAWSSPCRTLISSSNAFLTSTIKADMDNIRVTRFQTSVKAGHLHLHFPHQGACGCGPHAHARRSLPCRQAQVRGGHLCWKCTHGCLLQERRVLRRHDDVRRNADVAVAMMVQHGEVAGMRRMFNKMTERDTVRWNTIMDALTEVNTYLTIRR